MITFCTSSSTFNRLCILNDKKCNPAAAIMRQQPKGSSGVGAGANTINNFGRVSEIDTTAAPVLTLLFHLASHASKKRPAPHVIPLALRTANVPRAGVLSFELWNSHPRRRISVISCVSRREREGEWEEEAEREGGRARFRDLEKLQLRVLAESSRIIKFRRGFATRTSCSTSLDASSALRVEMSIFRYAVTRSDLFIELRINCDMKLQYKL